MHPNTLRGFGIHLSASGGKVVCTTCNCTPCMCDGGLTIAGGHSQVHSNHVVNANNTVVNIDYQGCGELPEPPCVPKNCCPDYHVQDNVEIQHDHRQHDHKHTSSHSHCGCGCTPCTCEHKHESNSVVLVNRTTNIRVTSGRTTPIGMYGCAPKVTTCVKTEEPCGCGEKPVTDTEETAETTLDPDITNGTI